MILTKLRKPYHYEHDFVDLNLDARHGADIVIVKIGYLRNKVAGKIMAFFWFKN